LVTLYLSTMSQPSVICTEQDTVEVIGVLKALGRGTVSSIPATINFHSLCF
jgi:hypothetical protein